MNYSGILAKSPKAFANSGHIEPCNLPTRGQPTSFAMTNHGLQMNLMFQREGNERVIPLACQRGGEYLKLRLIADDHVEADGYCFWRRNPDQLEFWKSEEIRRGHFELARIYIKA